MFFFPPFEDLIHWVVVFPNIFYFHSYLGKIREDFQFDEYFSNGLKVETTN